MKRKTKSDAISEQLQKEILSGKFDYTRMLPSEHQLMRRFSVARETVRAAIRDLMGKNLVGAKRGLGTFLVDCASVRASQKFGVIVPDAFYPFYSRICQGIEEGAKERGWTILSCALGSGQMRERAIKAMEFAGVCAREKVGGVFFEPLQFLKDGEEVNRAILDVLRKANIPVVLLDSDFLPLPQRSEYDLVGVNNMQVGYSMARHAIARGAKRVMYFSNPMPAPTSVDRGNGVGFAVAEAGLHWGKECILFADPSDARVARRLFAGKNRPDAIMAVNDYVASLLLKTLKDIGMRVPDDVLLVGVNGDPVA